MRARNSQSRISGSPASSRPRVSPLFLALFASMATLYVAGRLWQDAEEKVYLVQELDQMISQGRSALSVGDTLQVMNCREQQKRLSVLETELARAREEGFDPKSLSRHDETPPRKNILAVIGIITTFGRTKNRNAIRKAWMPTGSALKKLEDDKSIVVRFVIGRSSEQGDSLDMETDRENRQTNDFIVLDDQKESPDELQKKIMSFFVHAVDNWDAEFFVKVNDDVFVNIDALGAILTSYLDTPRIYVGCMKSGEVLSERTNKWYEPDWWKFGDAKSYFRHASGDIYAISRALAQYISINRNILRSYAHDDVSTGSWFIGLDVNHVDQQKFCCSAQPSGVICANA